jgi:thymidylate synthase
MEFPVVDAFLVCPEEGAEGRIGICTNTLAPSSVVEEVPTDLKKDVSVIGRLVVNRDGAERMILNCLSHPTIEYVILFGEEASNFCPSTNMLLALMDGYDSFQDGNLIAGGKGLAYQYPNVSLNVLEQFRKHVTVLPIYKHNGCSRIVERYMQWLRPRVPEDVYNCVARTHDKKKIYYDSLVKLIKVLSEQPAGDKESVMLDPREFQHLQPPIVNLDEDDRPIEAGFEVSREGDEIQVKLDFGTTKYGIKGQDSFRIAYSIMHYVNRRGLQLYPEQQLFLGAELSRVEMEIKSGVKTRHFAQPKCDEGELVDIPLQPDMELIPDEIYYYRIFLKEGSICVQSLAYDTEQSVCEYRSKRLEPLLRIIADENRFEDYEQQFLHRVDVGIEAGRAAIALEAGKEYIQDFRNIFSVNKTDFPLLVVEGDSFLSNHKQIITRLYTDGLTMTHPDTHKGTMRSGTVLAVYRRSGESLAQMPQVYGSGTQTTEDMRKQYKEQLLASDDKGGAYTYGERTRHYFGKDQLALAAESLKQNPGAPFVVQRFDYAADMSVKEVPVTDDSGNVVRTRIEATHDPCLTHDIYFLVDGKLHSFHIARAHNIVNAYPENIFGLHDAYDSYVAEELGAELGDMFMLSNRGNILLLIEEQKAKKLISEPSRAVGDVDVSAGPFDLASSSPNKGVGYCELDLVEKDEKPDHACLAVLEDYEGQNIIEKAAKYLKTKGLGHNNPVIGTYNPRKGGMDETQRLVFFQCNKRGGRLQATAVFLNGTREGYLDDVALCNYVATQYSKITEVPLGKLFLFYVPVRTG